jgi:hypothetical protein
MVRTGGASASNDSMVWSTVETALYFINMPWPDFTGHAFGSALRWYGLADRDAGTQAPTLAPAPDPHLRLNRAWNLALRG